MPIAVAAVASLWQERLPAKVSSTAHSMCVQRASAEARLAARSAPPHWSCSRTFSDSSSKATPSLRLRSRSSGVCGGAIQHETPAASRKSFSRMQNCATVAEWLGNERNTLG